MNMFDTQNTTDSGVAYYSRGESENVALLVHGSFGTAAMWATYVEPLVAAGYRVVALDLAGHGNSEGDLTTLDMDSYAGNVRDVIYAEQTTPAVLIGHSMSGLVVLMNAIDGLASRVVAIDPSPSMEIQGEQSTEGIPDRYDSFDAGMPSDPAAAMETLPDIAPDMMMSLMGMLGDDSGAARRQRKAGISIPEGVLDDIPVLFIAAGQGATLPFGVKPDLTRQMAAFYEKPLHVVEQATHPGVLMGAYAPEAVDAIVDFLP